MKKKVLATERVAHYQATLAGFVSPYDFLLLTMNGLDNNLNPIEVDMRTKVECAKAATPYTNPKLSQIMVEQEEADLPQHEKLLKIAELLEKHPELLSVLKGDKDE